jgi:hypothetical protein
MQKFNLFDDSYPELTLFRKSSYSLELACKTSLLVNHDGEISSSKEVSQFFQLSENEIV